MWLRLDVNSADELTDAAKSPPNPAEPMHLRFFQSLHAAGENKDEITKLTVDEFPNLCKGRGDGSEVARAVAVRTIVELNTSKWADKYI